MTATYFVDTDGTFNPHSFFEWWTHMGAPAAVRFALRPEPLVAARKAAGIEAGTLAAAIGISAQYLSDIEHGHRPLSPQIAAAYRRELP